MPGTASSVSGFLPLLVVIALAAAVAVLLWVQSRDRRQIAALLERLERLESTRGETPDEAPPRTDGRSAAGALDAVAVAPSSEPTGVHPSGDVLHGRTTHVQRLIGGGGEAQTLADQAIVRVHTHIEENLTPHRLAWELCVSLRTLERGLGLALACTPRQLILAMKMREARQMLTQGLRVGEVASRLGFSNPFHFSRRFKDFYHVAPSEVRPQPHGGE